MNFIKKNIRLVCFAVLLSVVTSCGSERTIALQENSKLKATNVNSDKKITDLVAKKALASYYADSFQGKKTASGKPLDNKKQTCAHRTLPFGTVLKVTNLANQKWVEVVVTDRGPHKKTRTIDLTKKAFMDITDNKNKGELTVRIEILE